MSEEYAYGIMLVMQLLFCSKNSIAWLLLLFLLESNVPAHTFQHFTDENMDMLVITLFSYQRSCSTPLLRRSDDKYLLFLCSIHLLFSSLPSQTENSSPFISFWLKNYLKYSLLSKFRLLSQYMQFCTAWCSVFSSWQLQLNIIIY